MDRTIRGRAVSVTNYRINEFLAEVAYKIHGPPTSLFGSSVSPADSAVVGKF
jgi:hypothetical protein